MHVTYIKMYFQMCKVYYIAIGYLGPIQDNQDDDKTEEGSYDKHCI